MYVCPECGATSPGPGFCTNDGAPLGDGGRDPLLGQAVGSYRLARLIGAGGMGEVYRGVQPQIGSRVAIKILSHDCAKSPALVERFFAEARAVNVIRHENIVNVIDLAALPDGRPYIVMEHLDGEPLSALIRRLGPLPLGTLSRLLGEVLDALRAAHDKGIVHRDLKPDNVFVTRGGRAKVLDFGIAKLRPDVAALNDATRTGSLLGTPHYMSPEQAVGRPVDARSDLYSTGVILFECSTGRKPFDASTLYELLRQHVEHAPIPPRSLRPDMPPPYEAVILRALEKDPARRFQSAAAFASALSHATLELAPAAWAPIGSGSSSGPALAGFAPTGAPFGQSPSALSGSAGSVPATAPSPGAAPPPAGLGLFGPGGAPGFSAPATSPGYVNTLAPGGAALSESKTGSGTKLGIAAFATCGVIALAGMVTMIALAIIGSRKKSDDGSTPVTGPVVAKPTLSPSPAPTLPTQTPLGSDFDASRFDVGAFLPRAESIAKKHYSDAALVRFDSNGINPEGVINMTLSSSNYVLYRYRSPEHSKRPANFPVNAEFESNCVVYVMVNSTGITSFVPDKMSCEMPIIGAPRCTPAQVWKEAAQRGAQTGNYVGMLGWWADDHGKGRFYLNVTGGYSGFLPDSC